MNSSLETFSWGKVRDNETRCFILKLMDLVYSGNSELQTYVSRLTDWSAGSSFDSQAALRTFDEFVSNGLVNDQDYYYYDALIQLVVDTKALPCPANQVARPATNFAQLIPLIQRAESMLISAGISDVEDRIPYLRGIYYGTPWSLDYSLEHSNIRNRLFNGFTRPSLHTFNMPGDPRPYLECGVFEALFNSAEIKKSTDGRALDWGHVIIGLESRINATARTGMLPPFGGSGLECNTWLGDLGGGAGTCAYRRSVAPSTRATSIFPADGHGSSFGAIVNLEGNIASYVVGREISPPDEPDEPTDVIFPSNGSIASIVQDYLGTTSPSPEWNDRARIFLQMKGGVINGGVLTNRASLIVQLAAQIETFGSWYIIKTIFKTTALPQVPAKIQATSKHMTGAALEVASIFVDSLVHTMNHPLDLLKYRTDPNPTPPSATGSAILDGLYGALDWEQQVTEDAHDVIDKLIERARDLFRTGF